MSELTEYTNNVKLVKIKCSRRACKCTLITLFALLAEKDGKLIEFISISFMDKASGKL